jgi:hypothetical protein
MPIIITSRGKLVTEHYSKLERLYLELQEICKKQQLRIEKATQQELDNYATSFYNFPRWKAGGKT